MKTSRTRLSKGIRDFALLLYGNFLEMRMSWSWFLAFMSFNAIMFLVFLYMTVGRNDPAASLYIVTGSLTQSLSIAGMLSLGQEIGRMKDYSIFDFYATLPISKVSFITALVSRSLVFTIPSLVFSLVFASVVLRVTVVPNAFLLLVILLGGYGLVGLGAIIGFYSKNGRVAGLVTQIVSPIITYLAPVFIPKEDLPVILQKTSLLFPTTYVADALRAAVSGTPISESKLAVGVLAAWMVISIVLVLPRLDWRERRG